MGAEVVEIVLPTGKSAKILKWKVKEGTIVSVGRVILLYDINPNNGKEEQKKLKANQVGTVRKLLAKEGEIVHPGYVADKMRLSHAHTSFKDTGLCMCTRHNNYGLPRSADSFLCKRKM
jgi:hypothetical protein